MLGTLGYKSCNTNEQRPEGFIIEVLGKKKKKKRSPVQVKYNKRQITNGCPAQAKDNSRGVWCERERLQNISHNKIYILFHYIPAPKISVPWVLKTYFPRIRPLHQQYERYVKLF